ncbi:MAG TPA: argininosuccinate lyase [Candidatus Dormibacteraeota bacterium]|nr:argininosuccinate lyase [Candidatus Dormibacteraeota bacterium]
MRPGGADRGAALGSAGQADGKGEPLSQQPWGGRFSEEPDPLIDRFTRSLAVDSRLFHEDIAGSRAYAKALVGAGVLTPDEQSTIDQALQEIRTELESELSPPPLGEGWVGVSQCEDIHMLIEQRLRDKLGPLGGKLHTGRSRNDQVALDVRLYVKHAGAELIEAVPQLEAALIKRAKEHAATVMPGYTHTQRAQPVLLAHHLLAYVEMLRRDRGRLADAIRRADVSPLGAGALAGSGFPIDRQALADALGFASASANSLDTVGDRDFVVELISACSIAMVHLSRLCGEIVLWTSAEFGFATLPDALASGSSMMPNKKNPCAAELVRAKTGRVTGDLVTILMVLKGLPLAYNRDLQEDKEALFDAVDTTIDCLQVSTKLVEGMGFDVDRMRTAAISGYTLATELADYLSNKGMPFREAHRLVGQIVASAIASKRGLESYALPELQAFSPLFEADVTEHQTLEGALKSRDVLGGTAPRRVKEALASVQT